MYANQKRHDCDHVHKYQRQLFAGDRMSKGEGCQWKGGHRKIIFCLTQNLPGLMDYPGMYKLVVESWPVFPVEAG